MIDPNQVREADAPQIVFPDAERNRLITTVETDYFHCIADHDIRMRRFQRYYMHWRNRSEPPIVGEETDSNFRVPITQWQVYSKLAKEHGSLFGDDSEVVAKAVGPDDQRRVRKIGRFMTWRLFNSMRIQNPACVFNFRKILFGRAHAYAPWRHETFDVPLRDGTEKECLYYDGPGFDPLWPDDFICPAEDVKSLHEFSFVMRRLRATPDQLLRGEEEGRYQGISDNFANIVNFSNDRRRRDYTAERVKYEKDLAEGVLYEGSLSAANALVVWEWYGRWRRLKGRRDASESNLKGRERFESDIVLRYLPDMHLLIGAQDLGEMYPYKRNRRPFVEASLLEDGSYWGPGFGELLESMEDELSVNHNLMTDGGMLSVGPVIFYRPASGFNPDNFKYRPGTAVACEDPNGVKVVEFKADLQPCVLKEQNVLGYSERVTGLTDQNLGRVQDRPNAPRTARQTMALLEEGDVRASIDMSVLRECWGEIITHFWELERMYGSASTFFRVTEEDADGLFPVMQGGAFLDENERAGTYDFDLKFATNAVSKQQRRQEQLALYQIDLQNPLVVNNPRALWFVLDKIHRAFGDDRFSDIVPQPPDLDAPVNPIEEWTRSLEGEPITVNPNDNDQLHIQDHNRRLVEAATDPQRNDVAYRTMEHHVIDHIHQMQQKKLMSAMVSELANRLRDPSQGIYQGPQGGTSLESLQGALSGLQGQQPEQPQQGGKRRPPQRPQLPGATT